MLRFSKNSFINFELLRVLSTAPYGGCEVAEFLEVAEKAAKGPVQWHQAWQAAGERVEAIAEAAAARGDAFTARCGYLRASSYFRASQYMMSNVDDISCSLPIAYRSVRNFHKALPLLQNCANVLRAKIPYRAENGEVYQLPAYLYMPLEEKAVATRGDSGRIPVLIANCGADSTQEESYFMFAAAGIELGYAVLTYEGPGQAVPLREYGLTFRQDWEVVTSTVLDWLIKLSEGEEYRCLDTGRVALAGASMGGYLALRGAADARVSACISIDAFYSLWDFVKGRMPAAIAHLWESGWIPDCMLNGVAVVGRTLGGFQDRWELEVSKWMFGVETPTEMFRRVMQFTFGPVPAAFQASGTKAELADGGDSKFLHRITCPVLISGGGMSLYFNKLEDTAGKIYNELINVKEADKVLWRPSEASMGGVQAKVGAFGMLQLKSFSFLDRAFGIKRQHLNNCSPSGSTSD